ncbi:MAG: transaldolase, partial [Solirubrobacteraceae bacterium]
GGLAMTTPNPKLQALTDAGVAVWLDSLKRSYLTGGTLEQWRDEYVLHGVTTNPAIFGEAFKSDEYDDQIASLAADGLDAREIYRTIAAQDVRDACDVLRPVYDATGGADGFVSFEVDPDLARDSDKTIAQAIEYHARVDRPNLMIKIPGTDEGLPAIEEALYRGINVNVTLLFSTEAYGKVLEAWLKGLERRQAEGLDLAVESVASFFVSRVDSEVDKRLEGKAEEPVLRGKAAIANARAAYQLYLEIRQGERFAALEAAGARPQRPLWASTGVKDPAYTSTKYVDSLIAAETVNTMPLGTVEATAESGTIVAGTAAIDPTADLDAIAAAGIDLGDVTELLLSQGISKFEEPMDALLATIEEKRIAATKASA